MKDSEVLGSWLMETLRETKDAMEYEELDGHLTIHMASRSNPAKTVHATALPSLPLQKHGRLGSKVEES
jgi:hypothetical protein